MKIPPPSKETTPDSGVKHSQAVPNGGGGGGAPPPPGDDPGVQDPADIFDHNDDKGAN